MDPASVFLFWVGVVLQLAGFGLQWRRVERMAREIAELKNRELGGNLFVNEPVFFTGDMTGAGLTTEDHLAAHHQQIAEIREALLKTRADIRDNIASTTQAAVHRFEHKVDRVVLLHEDPTGLESLVLFIVGLVLSSAAAMA